MDENRVVQTVMNAGDTLTNTGRTYVEGAGRTFTEQRELYHGIAQSSVHHKRPGSVWITVLKIFAWLSFVAGVVFGVLNAIAQVNALYGNYNSSAALISLVVNIALAVIVPFLVLAVIMVLLNAAIDLDAIRINTSHRYNNYNNNI